MTYFLGKNWTKERIFHSDWQILFVVTLSLMKKMCGVMFLIAKVKTDFNVLWYWFVSHYCKSLSFISATNFNMKKNHRWKDAPKSLAFKADHSKEQALVGLWSDLFILLCLCLVFDTTHLSVSLTSFPQLHQQPWSHGAHVFRAVTWAAISSMG